MKKMRILAPPGTKDILPEEIRMDRYVESVFMDKCRLFGYNEIHTPVFEYSSLFVKGVGHVTDIVEKELYTFSDKHGERLALRPEGTTSVARAVLEHNMLKKLPAKLCYKITCYRQEDPQEGRLREFHQIGAECYGSAAPEADSEVISLAHAALTAMEVCDLRLNINSLGCDKCRVAFLNELARYLLPYANRGELCDTCVGRLAKNPIRVLDCKQSACKSIAAGAPAMADFLCPDCLEHYKAVKADLSAIGIEFHEKPTLMRGLDYYNRTVFEFKAGKGGSIGTVCGGGRYDDLCRRIGGDRAVPAVGFAIGEERTVMAMPAGVGKMMDPGRPEVYVNSEDVFLAAVGAGRLRAAGICAEYDLVGSGPETREADGEKALWVALADKNGIKLTRRETGEEHKLTAGDWAGAARIVAEEQQEENKHGHN